MIFLFVFQKSKNHHFQTSLAGWGWANVSRCSILWQPRNIFFCESLTEHIQSNKSYFNDLGTWSESLKFVPLLQKNTIQNKILVHHANSTNPTINVRGSPHVEVFSRSELNLFWFYFKSVSLKGTNLEISKSHEYRRASLRISNPGLRFLNS